jgi:hypothetical protein
MLSTALCLFLILVTVAVLTTWMQSKGEGFQAGKEKHYWWMEDAEDTQDTHEGFQSANKPAMLMPEHSPVLEFIPDGPSPVDLYNRQSYLLLEDIKGEATVKNPVVTAQGCYNADFENQISKLGSYRQFTNNYKHDAPDNCSTLNKDVSLNFYAA